MADRLTKALAGLPLRVDLSYASHEPAPPRKTKAPVVLGCDEPPPTKVVVCLRFSEPGVGFGEITIRQTAAGVFVDSECMGADRVKRYLSQLIDSAILDIDRNPKRHRLYNRVTGTRCGAWCKICHKPRKREALAKARGGKR